MLTRSILPKCCLLRLLPFWAAILAACAAGVAAQNQGDEAQANPGVVRLVRGPGSQALELLESATAVLPQALMGFADWASINDRLTGQAERLLYGQLSRDEMEINPKDSLAEVAIKVTLQNLPMKLARTATSTNILFQRTRKLLRAGNQLMERDSDEHKRWLRSQIKGLEDAAQEEAVEEFLQARSLLLSISSEVESDESADPDNPPRTALFTVSASLAPARKWAGEGWGRWGSISLTDLKISIKLPRDLKRESLFREKLLDPKLISTFGVNPVDRMVWPPIPLREQYRLLNLLSEHDDKAYFEALQRVAQRGDGEGQFLLGQAYDRGEGTPANASLAAKWWEESAKSGYAPGLCAAAEAYLSGNGLARDEERGLKYLEKAAGLGFPRALVILGGRELAKNGSAPPNAPGFVKIKKAAAEGDPSGLYLLSIAYLTGSGISKDLARSEQLLRAASGWGHPSAMLALGRHYSTGGENTEAWPWFYLAAKYNTALCKGNYDGVQKEAVSEILRLRKELPAADLNAAQRKGTALEAVYRPLWTRQ